MRFTKMQGVGNDFVVVAGRDLPVTVPLPELAVRTCDRKFGIGADGLLVVSRDETPGTAFRNTAFRMRMFNPDGSEDMCGNGLRCVSLWAHREGWLGGQTKFTVAVKDGVRSVRMLSVSDDGREAMLGVDMGVPQFSPDALPFASEDDKPIVGYPLTVNGTTYAITTVNTGSTHSVIFGSPPTEDEFQSVSPLIENHVLFPERTSVLWATLRDAQTLDIRIWERGAGETLGCGTGACAVAVAASVNNLSEPNVPLAVVSKGGTLKITWPGDAASSDSDVDMVGPAQIVYSGDFALDPA